LQFVAFEVRVPHAPKLATLEGATDIYDDLRDLVPIIPGSGPSPIEVAAPQGAISFTPRGGQTRMMNRGRTISVMVAPTALVVETTAYTRFEDFLEVVRRALEAAHKAVSFAGIQRVGLRYIDEIRVEGVQRPGDWDGYINSALLCATRLDTDLRPERTEGRAEFEIDGGHRTVMRFGAMTGRVVDPGGPLRVRRTSEGSFFLIDLDSFWLPRDEDIPEFSVERVVETCTKLREPIRTLFEASITERLRNEVLRKEVSEHE
jgi:uncharacterized protein (TIGR04255 family)